MNNEQVFEWAMRFILEHEGDYVDDDQDPGGETNFGISQRYHPDVDVESLDRIGAIRIYRERYWDKYRCGEMHPAMGLSLMDAVVNQPADWAVRQLQQVVGTAVDGIVGPKTVGAANLHARAFELGMFHVRRIDRYVTRDNYSRYGSGWVRRVLECHATACEQL